MHSNCIGGHVIFAETVGKICAKVGAHNGREGTVQGVVQCLQHCPPHCAPWKVPGKELAICAVMVVNVQRMVLKFFLLTFSCINFANVLFFYCLVIHSNCFIT